VSIFVKASLQFSHTRAKAALTRLFQRVEPRPPALHSSSLGSQALFEQIRGRLPTSLKIQYVRMRCNNSNARATDHDP
jgi:hypothetical protein